jgi:predicted metalloprotease with PDZ domain
MLAVVLAACASIPPSAPAPRASSAAAAPAALLWEYEVTADAALDLDVRATLRGPVTGGVRVDEAATAFVDRLEVADGATWRKQSVDDPRWDEACATRCTLRYHVRLRDLAKKAADLDVAIAAGGAIFSPPSTWLLRPSAVTPGRYRFRMKTTAGARFATGIRAAVGPGSEGAYEADTTTLEESAFAAFGALRVGHVADPAIEHAIAPGVAIPDEAIGRWLRAEVSAIGSYFGRPPNGHAMLFVAPGTSEMTGGKTLGGGGASIVVRLGTRVSARELMDDWVVAHELVHVAFPDLDRRYTWFSEGLATYVEPIARARAGLVTREKVWSEIVDGLPQGVPGPEDGGLDGATGWGRVYWGGALYFLLADIRIRERTKNARSLDDALRAVIATGGNVETMWPFAQVLEVGDRATGTTVMREVYDELGPARRDVDVHALLRRLGVRVEGGVLRFDDGAPLAAIRDRILAPR